MVAGVKLSSLPACSLLLRVISLLLGVGLTTVLVTALSRAACHNDWHLGDWFAVSMATRTGLSAAAGRLMASLASEVGGGA